MRSIKSTETEVRNVTIEEFDNALSLSEFAFQYKLSPEEKEKRKEKAKLNQIWGCFTEGKLSAKMHIFDFQTWINGRLFEMGGIAGVATWPEYRRQGMVAHLLKHGLQVMRDRGQTISFLHPFSFAFYRKYGWETYTDYKEYELGINQVPVFPLQPGSIKRVGEDWVLLNSIYERFAMDYSGSLKRDEEWWSQTVFKQKPGQRAVYIDRNGDAGGYILYEVNNRKMTVHEFVFLHEEARQGLWKFIRDHDSMISVVTLTAPENDALPFLLAEPRIKQETIPYFMARIVDFCSFLEQYPFVATGVENMPFTLKVTDPHAPWNEGIFEVRIADTGSAVVSPSSAEHTDMLLSVSIGTLSTMLMGYHLPSFLHKIGKLQGNIEEVMRFERFLPRQTTYLPDFF